MKINNESIKQLQIEVQKAEFIEEVDFGFEVDGCLSGVEFF